MKSAGRANARETRLLKVANNVGKALTVIGIGLSLYPIATAEEWGNELGYQVESWSGAIAGGRLGIGWARWWMARLAPFWEALQYRK